MNEAYEILTLDRDNEKEFYQIVREYLPDSDMDKLPERAVLYPKAFVVLLLNHRVIGVAFGWPRKLDVPEDNSFTLDGIAVSESYHRNGYGRALLKAFEKAVYNYGFSKVSVGSAGGYVEKFYMGCGYVPIQYKVYLDNRIVIEKVFENITDYRMYQRKNADGFVVMEKHLIFQPEG